MSFLQGCGDCIEQLPKLGPEFDNGFFKTLEVRSLGSDKLGWSGTCSARLGNNLLLIV